MIAPSWAEWVKYNPHWADQPRVPAGQPEGGQWSQGGSEGGSGGAEGGNGQGTGGDAPRPAPGHTTPPTTARDHVPPGTFGHTKNFTWNEDLMTEGDKDEALKTIKELFGPHVPVEHVLSLAGTLDGSKVALSASGYGGTKILTIMHESPEIERDPNTYEITKGHEAVRELYVEADGRMYLHNDLFAGPGKGLDMFGRQVEAATQYGIGHIETAAAGDGDPKTGKADGRFNGYYTWPRFGYDADLDRNQLEKIPDHLKPQVQAAGGRVSGLMATKEGRDWWRGNGSDLEAKFDLTPGSYSQRTFNAYLRERDKVKASWAEWVKYNRNWADQPRVPAGQPGGGQWAGDDADGEGQEERIQGSLPPDHQHSPTISPGTNPAESGVYDARPVPPTDNAWKSDQHIAEQGQAMAQAHEADPHLHALRQAWEEANAKHGVALISQLAAVGSKDRSALQKANEAVEATKKEVDRLHEGLAHEARRSLLQSFRVQDFSQRAELRGDYARSNSTQAQNWEKARDFLSEVVSKQGVGDQSVKIKSVRGRAYYDDILSSIHTAKTDDVGITVHEFGHHLEKDDWVKERVQAFRQERFQDTDKVNLAEKFPHAGYGKEEEGNPDDMKKVFGNDNEATYAGKTYQNGATEILSMGLEKLYRDPVHFARADPSYFSLVMGILQRKGK